MLVGRVDRGVYFGAVVVADRAEVVTVFALSSMDPTVQGVLFLVAVVLFVLAAIGVSARVNLVAAGLAFFAFVFAWQAFAAG